MVILNMLISIYVLGFISTMAYGLYFQIASYPFDTDQLWCLDNMTSLAAAIAFAAIWPLILFVMLLIRFGPLITPWINIYIKNLQRRWDELPYNPVSRRER